MEIGRVGRGWGVSEGVEEVGEVAAGRFVDGGAAAGAGVGDGGDGGASVVGEEHRGVEAGEGVGVSSGGGGEAFDLSSAEGESAAA